MLIVLGLVLYVFVFIKFILFPILPQIGEKNNEIIQLQSQKQAMDRDLKAIEAKKLEIREKTLSNQRLEEYLMNSAAITDSIEYVEKLAKYIGKDLSAIKVNKPGEVEVEVQAAGSSANTDDKSQESAGSTQQAASSTSGSGGGQQQQADAGAQKTPVSKFYELSVEFDTVLTYEEAYNLVQYCEGSARKVRISKFLMIPYEEKDQRIPTAAVTPAAPAASAQEIKKPDTAVPAATQAQQEPANGSSSQKFKVSMGICFYSQTSGTMDKIYDFTRGKFQQYIGSPGVPFVKPTEQKDGKIVLPDIAAGDAGVKDGSEAARFAGADVILYQKGYLYAGENFMLYSGANKGSRITYKTKDRVDVNLRLGSSGFDVEALADNGSRSTLNGFFREGDFVVFIDVDVPYAKENENLGINLKVQNDSGRNINIRMNDRLSKVRLLDRNGSSIVSKSAGEKLYLI